MVLPLITQCRLGIYWDDQHCCLCTALGGDTSILDAGITIVAVGLSGIVMLAAWSLAQILIEVRDHGVPFSDSRSTSSAAHDGIIYKLIFTSK